MRDERQGQQAEGNSNSVRRPSDPASAGERSSISPRNIPVRTY